MGVQVSNCEQEAARELGNYTDMGSAARSMATDCQRAGNVRRHVQVLAWPHCFTCLRLGYGDSGAHDGGLCLRRSGDGLYSPTADLTQHALKCGDRLTPSVSMSHRASDPLSLTDALLLQASVRVYRDSKDAVARTVTALSPLHEQLAAAPAAGRQAADFVVTHASMHTLCGMVICLHVRHCQASARVVPTSSL